MNEKIERNFCDVLNRLQIAVRDEDTINCLEDIVSPTTEDGVPIRKLFVSNLAERSTYKDLSALFSKYGNVESCYLIRSQGKSNYAFVTFSSVQDAIRARIDGTRQEIRLHNRDLRVMPADSWHQPDCMENSYYTNMSKKGEDKSVKEEIDQDDTADDITNSCIHILNDDCLIHIFLFLPIVDRIRIERVCKRWRAVSQESWFRIRSLDLSSSTWGFPLTSRKSHIDTVMLRKVLLRCGRFLTRLDISQVNHRLGQSTLTVVGKLCPNLQKINVTALNISPSGIISLTNNCHDIIRLSLGPSTYASDSDLKKLFIANQKLKYLKVEMNFMTGKCLSYLPPNIIEEISLEQCTSIQSHHLSNALSKYDSLKVLSLHQCIGVSGSVMEAIGTHCTSLKVLELSGTFPLISANDMYHIGSLVNLEVLKVGDNDIVTDELLTDLASKCRLLSYLDVHACEYVADDGLLAVSTLPNLETLKMNQLSATDRIFYNGNMCNLKKLECRQCTFLNDVGVCILIQNSPRLELLDLSGCRKITNTALEVAAATTKCRNNNVILKMFIGGTCINLNEFSNVSPFLQVVNVDLSDIMPSLLGYGRYYGDDSPSIVDHGIELLNRIFN